MVDATVDVDCDGCSGRGSLCLHFLFVADLDQHLGIA